MVLCKICKSIDFRSLLTVCRQQYRAIHEITTQCRPRTSCYDRSVWVKQHETISELENGLAIAIFAQSYLKPLSKDMASWYGACKGFADSLQSVRE
jgi:hypothetical protein